MKRWLPLILIGLLTLLLVVGLSRDPRAVPSPLIGQPAPALPQRTLADEPFQPPHVHGQAWILNVWASWCAACREEHPHLMRLRQRLSLPLIGLAWRDERAAATAWLARHGNPYGTVLVDESGVHGIDWGVYGVPETFIIGADGRILHKFTGPVTEATLIERLRQLELIP